ncbi:U-actitoxin-Avd3r-like [Rhynchophorus ferrugineus]|uniref:U-actitoxin-Avd3r-like n=1 Tax=Rhynchophorus ferrugineus TaxID=354439 RepID=UPI003FCCDECD
MQSFTTSNSSAKRTREMVLKFVVLCLVVHLASPAVSNFSEADCTKPYASPDVCKARVLRYYWDNNLQSCQPVYWGGCNATPNNFPTLELCQSVAPTFCA